MEKYIICVYLINEGRTMTYIYVYIVAYIDLHHLDYGG